MLNITWWSWTSCLLCQWRTSARAPGYQKMEVYHKKSKSTTSVLVRPRVRLREAFEQSLHLCGAHEHQRGAARVRNIGAHPSQLTLCPCPPQ